MRLKLSRSAAINLSFYTISLFRESFMARLVDIIGNEASSITARNSAIEILLTLVDKAKS